MFCGHPCRNIAERRNMKRLATLLTLLIYGVALASSSSKPDPDRIWITDVVIISPENLDHVEKGSVLIEHGRITRVDTSQKAKRPEDATVISGNGQYLIPGLMDSHVHVSSIPGMDTDEVKLNEPLARSYSKHEALVESYLKQLPRSYLYYGYTTLVDLVAPFPQELSDFRHEPLHPDLYDCNPSMPFANGYPMSYAPPEERFKLFPNFIYDPTQAATVPPQYKPEDHTPAADVARVKNAGGVCVKTFFERGFGGVTNLPVMSPDVLSEIRRAATANGLVLMIHANSFEAQGFAVNGNVDVIAHGMWNWGDLDKSQSPELPDQIKELLDQIVKKRIGYQPTTQVLYGLEALFDPDYLKSPALTKVVPKDLIEWFESPEGMSFKKEINPGGEPDAAMLQAFKQGPVRRVHQVVAYLASKDANLLFGTDTPSAPTYGNLPGLNGFLEMKNLQMAGMSLKQILRAATINNAREFKLESQIGTIEPGKVANLVLMTKNPLETIDAYDSITTVFMHGKPISRKDLAVQ
jgi:imidazolonepropionase-like amidohydrolase